MSLRRIEPHELADVARVHSSAFPDAALTFLGLDAIRHYYSAHLECADAIMYGAWDDDALQGFVCAGVFPGAIGRFVRRSWRTAAYSTITQPWLLARRRLWQRLGSVAVALAADYSKRFLTRERPKGARVADVSTFCVLAIATRPSARTRGIGGRLMAAAEAFGRERGHGDSILFVHPENRVAIQFYTNRGWHPVNGARRWHGKMRKTL